MAETSELWRKFKESRDKESRDALIQAYLPLVRQIAIGIIKKLRSGVDLDDLVSDGVFGLMRAVEQFDLQRGVKFETYATPVIRGSIYNGMRSLDWVPERTRVKARALQRTMEKLTTLYGRAGTGQELAEELKISTAEVYDLIANLGAIYLLSLDQPISVQSDDEEITILDALEDKKAIDPSVEVEFREEREILKAAVESLNEREQYIMKMHYFEGVSFEKISADLGVTKQRVSQMHSRIIVKLREILSQKLHGDERAQQNFCM